MEGPFTCRYWLHSPSACAGLRLTPGSTSVGPGCPYEDRLLVSQLSAETAFPPALFALVFVLSCHKDKTLQGPPGPFSLELSEASPEACVGPVLGVKVPRAWGNSLVSTVMRFL